MAIDFQEVSSKNRKLVKNKSLIPLSTVTGEHDGVVHHRQRTRRELSTRRILQGTVVDKWKKYKLRNKN